MSNFRKTEHRYIYEHYFGSVQNNHVIHHKDHNSKNNLPSNLESMNRKDHVIYHSKNMLGENNPIFKIKADPSRFAAYSEKMSESCSGLKNGNAKELSNEEIRDHGMYLTISLGRRFSDQDWILYAQSKNLPQFFTEYRQLELGTVLDFAKKCAKICGISTEDIEEDPRLIETRKKAESQGYKAIVSDGETFVEKKCSVCEKIYIVSFE